MLVNKIMYIFVMYLLFANYTLAHVDFHSNSMSYMAMAMLLAMLTVNIQISPNVCATVNSVCLLHSMSVACAVCVLICCICFISGNPRYS